MIILDGKLIHTKEELERRIVDSEKNAVFYRKQDTDEGRLRLASVESMLRNFRKELIETAWVQFKYGELGEYFRWHWVELPSVEALLEKIRDDSRIYDADVCGDNTGYYVIGQDGEFRFFRIELSWWWKNYGQEDSHLANEFDTTEITEAEAREAAGKHWYVV